MHAEFDRGFVQVNCYDGIRDGMGWEDEDNGASKHVEVWR
jgi:hypothetical protein